MPPRLLWSLDYGGMVDNGPCRREGSVLEVFLSFVRVCVMVRKTRRRQLLEDGIRFSLSSPHSGDAYSVTGEHVEVWLQRILCDLVDVCLWWIRLAVYSFVYVRVSAG